MRFICYALLVFGMLPGWATTPGGLKFHGSELPINQRTSYNVFGEQVVTFADQFAVEFNLALYPTTEIGYLVRIKNQATSRIYNLFYDGQGGNLIFRFNEEGKNNLITATLTREELQNAPWTKMKIAFDLKADSIRLSIHDRTFDAFAEQLPDTYSPIILFGRSDHIIDVPSFAIRDLVVGNTDNFVFALKESKGTVVHDNNGDTFGEVVNPEWLVNDAYHWRHQVSFHSQTVAGSNYNASKKELYYFNRDSLRIFNVRSGDTKTVVFADPLPVKLKLGTNFLSAHGDTLYSFEAYVEDYNGPTVASLNLDTYEWTAQNREQLASPLHHNGAFLNPLSNRLILFGGFGRMHYSNDFFAYDLISQEWDTLSGFTGDFLSPRYFSSVGYRKETNTMYIFGGMGNESGEQIVGRKYYYDLYKVDLNTKRISKLWEIEWKQDNMVPVRGMVILNDSSFYTLCYPEHVSESLLKLYHFSLKDGQYEILGDSIPIRSDKITTNANIYYDSTLNSLYAVVQEFEDDISSDLKLYSLSFPPLTADALANYSKDKTDYTLVIIISVLAVGAGVGLVLLKKRSGKKHDLPDDGEQLMRSELLSKTGEATIRANAIYLFGEFTVHDKKNRDITYMFSAQLKQIFCLILQYSTTEGGIASQRLSSILWPDKPADKVKNSRGVTINHLRKVLSELEGIELVYDKKGHFKLELSEAFYSDYTRCMQIISSLDVEQHRNELLEILSRGKFLQLSDHPLFDAFKEEMEKKLEPVLIVEMEKSFDAEQYQEALAFADAIFNIDPLNEAALNFQIKAMQRLKLNDEARIRYQAFVIEYKKVMGSDYPHAYRI